MSRGAATLARPLRRRIQPPPLADVVKAAEIMLSIVAQATRRNRFYFA